MHLSICIFHPTLPATRSGPNECVKSGLGSVAKQVIEQDEGEENYQNGVTHKTPVVARVKHFGEALRSARQETINQTAQIAAHVVQVAQIAVHVFLLIEFNKQ